MARTRRGVVRIGISGWNYPKWRSVFYPEGLKHAAELEYASHRFSTIELNGSFYSLVRPTSVERWRSETPEDFVFSVKGSRFITHMKRLVDPTTALANFFGSGILALGEKLGPILWQLPPSMELDRARLGQFLELLPRTTREAARFARAHHDARIEHRSHFATATSHAIRYALEPRHASFATQGAKKFLHAYDVAMVVADSAGIFPSFDAMTSDFVYVRLHGDTKLYESGYSPAALSKWARRIRRWRRERDVYVYFDNDARVCAPFDAMALEALVAGRAPPLHRKDLTNVGEPARSVWPTW
jgi:uncharacterized protein YecE (DUF72 family)